MLLLILNAAFAQDLFSPSTSETVATPEEQPGLPRSFRNLSLGMSMEDVKEALKADGLFAYRGDPDVSLLPRPNESLIEVSGLSYIRRAFFQFHEDRLFVMIFAINESKMDHYSVFTSINTKYGKPQSLSPAESIWDDGVTRLSVERPLAVKYIDLDIFNSLKEAGRAEQSWEELLRIEFLDGF
ncbi:MAG: hypothetical protein AB7T74_10650 [Clostridia bacterium]|jgi:hypothetical protein